MCVCVLGHFTKPLCLPQVVAQTNFARGDAAAVAFLLSHTSANWTFREPEPPFVCFRRHRTLFNGLRRCSTVARASFSLFAEGRKRENCWGTSYAVTPNLATDTPPRSACTRLPSCVPAHSLKSQHELFCTVGGLVSRDLLRFRRSETLDTVGVLRSSAHPPRMACRGCARTRAGN